ncbi:hypothetical protein [Nocardioides sp.]|uniref:hypothetical protein n=1 Tax=Nocardioides sp. TaxID=35761 RepID=UPI003517EE3F
MPLFASDRVRALRRRVRGAGRAGALASVLALALIAPLSPPAGAQRDRLAPLPSVAGRLAISLPATSWKPQDQPPLTLRLRLSRTTRVSILVRLDGRRVARREGRVVGMLTTSMGTLLPRSGVGRHRVSVTVGGSELAGSMTATLTYRVARAAPTPSPLPG